MERIARTLAACDPDGGSDWTAYSYTAFNVLIAMRDPTEAQITAIDAALHDNWPNARQMAVAMHHTLVDTAMSEVVAGMYGVVGESVTGEADESSPLDWSRERLWLSPIVQQMLNAIAEGQIDSPELAGEPEVGIQPYRWHEEWAAAASAAMACADPRAPEPTPIADNLADALTWVLPLAKGYAAGRDVAANDRLIQNAEEILAAHAKGSADAAKGVSQ